ncbi:MAG: hypothetical protein AB1425_15345 [Actinomycetota bacterium]
MTRGSVSRQLMRLAPAGSLAGLGALAALEAHYLLAGLLGLGAAAAGRRLLDREGNARRELRRRARENARELQRVGREDRIAAPQMKRLAALQEGVLESWELLPEGYRPLLDEDMHTIIREVGDAGRLARRRAALRRHLESADRREILRRIEGLERDLATLEPGSPLRAPFESALEGRREELAGHDAILDGISIINAQLENAESLLSNLRGELLALDTGLAPGAIEPGLARLKERVRLFRQSMDEVARGVEPVPEEAATGRMLNG